MKIGSQAGIDRFIQTAEYTHITTFARDFLLAPAHFLITILYHFLCPDHNHMLIISKSSLASWL